MVFFPCIVKKHKYEKGNLFKFTCVTVFSVATVSAQKSGVAHLKATLQHWV